MRGKTTTIIVVAFLTDEVLLSFVLAARGGTVFGAG